MLQRFSYVINLFSCLSFLLLFSNLNAAAPKEEKKAFHPVDSLINQSGKCYYTDRARSHLLLDSAFKILSKEDYPIGLVHALANQGNYARQEGRLDDAILALDSSLNICKRFGFKREEAHNYLQLGMVETALNHNANSLSSYQKSLAIWEAEKDSALIGILQIQLANGYFNLNAYEESMAYFQKALKTMTLNGNVYALGNAYHGAAAVAFELKRNNEAKQYAYQAIDAFEQVKRPKGVILVLDMLSEAYSDNNQQDSALICSQKALELASIHDFKFGKATSLYSIGTILLTQGKQVQALSKLQAALVRFNEEGKLKNKGMVHQKLGICYTEMGEFQLAKISLDSALLFAKLDENFKSKKMVHEAFVDFYRAQGDFQNALKSYELKYLYQDSIMQSVREQNLANAKTSFDVESLERDKLLLSQQKKLGEQELEIAAERDKNKNQVIASLGLGAMLLAIIGFLAFRFYRNKVKKEQLDLEQRLLRSKLNPHFLFNALNSIQRLYLEGNTLKANDYLADFGQLMRKILDASSRAQISLNEEVKITELYLSLEKLRLGTQFSYEIEVDEELDLNRIHVPPMLFQPIVENAVWHGILPKEENGKVRIALSHQGEFLQCAIEDDGVGFKKEEDRPQTDHNSVGMSLTRERLGKRDRLQIAPHNPENLDFPGTRVTLDIAI